MDQLVGIILAGGQSSRMGQDKAQLIRLGQSMLQFNCHLLLDIGIKKVMISGIRDLGDHPDVGDLCCHCIADQVPDYLGPLSGIYSVLSELQTTAAAQAVLIMPIDMPLLTTELLGNLCDKGKYHGRACYYADHYLPLYLPLYLPYETQVLDYLKQQLFSVNGNLSVKGLIAACHGQSINHQYHQQLMNANTPQQWLQCQQQLIKRGSDE